MGPSPQKDIGSKAEIPPIKEEGNQPVLYSSIQGKKKDKDIVKPQPENPRIDKGKGAPSKIIQPKRTDKKNTKMSPDLDKCLKAIVNYVPINEAIRSEREKLGEYKFDNIEVPEGLEYVEKKVTYDEVYYGFMYVFYLNIETLRLIIDSLQECL